MPEDAEQLTWPAKVGSLLGDYTVRGQEVFPLRGRAVLSLAEDGSSAHLRAKFDPSGSGALTLIITAVGAAVLWYYVVQPWCAHFHEAGVVFLFILLAVLALLTWAACVLWILIRSVRRREIAIDLSGRQTTVAGPSSQGVNRWVLSGANTIAVDPNTHRMAFQANFLGVTRWVAFELGQGFGDAYTHLKATAPVNTIEAEIKGPGPLRKASVCVLLAVSAAGLSGCAVPGLWVLADIVADTVREAFMRWWAH